jgi:hypothetical protein
VVGHPVHVAQTPRLRIELILQWLINADQEIGAPGPIPPLIPQFC